MFRRGNGAGSDVPATSAEHLRCPERVLRYDRGMSGRSNIAPGRSGGGGVSRAEEAADEIRRRILVGELKPGERAPETKLAESLGISRNTLREALTALSREGLITQTPNKGACVAVPSLSAIIDIYRVRRLVEVQAVAQAVPRHPAIARMRAAVDAALAARETDDWLEIATANIRFHRAVFELTDSPRLGELYDRLATELRLAFGILDDPAYLHAPFLDRNEEIVDLLERGEAGRAAERFEEYLLLAERIILAGYERQGNASPSPGA